MQTSLAWPAKIVGLDGREDLENAPTEAGGRMADNRALVRAMEHALAYLDELPSGAVSATTSLAALRGRLGRALPEHGTDAVQVIDELVDSVAGGLLPSGSGRFFGWVIGGALTAPIAADWLASAWDQNAAIHATSPASAVVEEVCGGWLKDLLGLPPTASFAFVTGCQMAHVTCLAAARHRLLAERGWDVEQRGLPGAPPLRMLVTPLRHETLERAARILGLGADALEAVQADADGRMDVQALAVALAAGDAPTIVAVQAGELNTGAFDRFGEACDVADEHGAWVHVDGAFGLWANATSRYRHLLAGVERAKSWATDAHKWLNVPYDCGLAFVADPDAHQGALSAHASYRLEVEGARDPADWTPEWSRRARGFVVWAALRSLGRAGVAELVERSNEHAHRLVTGIGELDGAELLAEPVINQGLVRFLSPDGDHDRRTNHVIAALQAGGEAWFGGVEWRGMRAMRVSVSSWRTTAADVERAIGAVRAALAA
jgi:glutamate/tyrosine decarboxylase-like PLP-dependent enzyme